MAASNVRAGAAYIELGIADKMAAGLRRASKQIDAFGNKLRGIGAGMARVGAYMSAALTASLVPLGFAAKAAGDVAEVDSKFRALFKEQGDAAQAFADTLAKSVGRSTNGIKKALSAYQAFFVGLGFGDEQARKMSESLSSLALDFASFHNIADDEAMGRFISALSGSSEVLDQFGVNIKQAAIDQELLRMGLGVTAQSATEQQKSLARLAIITRAMTSQGAVGDAVRTSGSFANQLKRAKGEAFDLAAAIGQAIIPELAKVLKLFGAAAVRVTAFVKANHRLVVTSAAVVVGALAATTALTGLGFSFIGISAVVKAGAVVVGLAATAFSALAHPVIAVGAALVALGGYFAYATGAGDKALTFLAGKFTELRTIATEAFGGIADALAAGDIALAAEILWKSLKLAWTVGTQELFTTWAKFKSDFVQVAAAAFYGVAEIWAKVSANLQAAFSKAASFFRSVWATAITHTTTAFEELFRQQQKAQVASDVRAGTITPEEGEKRKQFIDEQFDAQQRIRKQEEAAADAQAKADLASRLQQIDQERQQTLSDIQKAEIALAAAAQQNATDSVNAIKAEIATLTAQLDRLRGEAKQAGAFAGAVAEGGLTGGGAALPTIGAGIGAAVERAMDKLTSPTGIFNPRALQSLVSGGTGIQEKQLRVQTESRQLLARIADRRGNVFT